MSRRIERIINKGEPGTLYYNMHKAVIYFTEWSPCAYVWLQSIGFTRFRFVIL